MKTNKQNTIVLIFQNVEIFYHLIDYQNEHSKSTLGFPIALYEQVLAAYLSERIIDVNDRKRILSALSLHNLKQSELLSYIDDSKGIFTIQNELLFLIKSIDSTRIRELGQPDLDIIYSQIRTLYDYFVQEKGNYSHHNHEFMENLNTLVDTMQDIFSKIAHNVRALEGSSKRLSEIVESHSFERQTPTEQVQKAIEEITIIYQRNIQPTLAFLNEKAMTPDSSAMFLIRKIREILGKTTFYEESDTIATIEMRLLSFVDVITNIRRKLHRYIEMSRKQRALYDAVEKRFNILHKLVVDQLDSKLTGKMLSSQHEFFNEATIFSQLNYWSRSSLIKKLMEFPEDFSRAEVSEYIRGKLQRADALGDKKHLPPKPRSDFKIERQKRKRVENIRRLMMAFTLTESSDLYQTLHHYLSQKLTDYSLKDIYDARVFLTQKYRIVTTLERGSIRYKQQELQYPIKQLKGK